MRQIRQSAENRIPYTDPNLSGMRMTSTEDVDENVRMRRYARRYPAVEEDSSHAHTIATAAFAQEMEPYEDLRDLTASAFILPSERMLPALSSSRHTSNQASTPGTPITDLPSLPSLTPSDMPVSRADLDAMQTCFRVELQTMLQAHEQRMAEHAETTQEALRALTELYAVAADKSGCGNEERNVRHSERLFWTVLDGLAFILLWVISILARLVSLPLRAVKVIVRGRGVAEGEKETDFRNITARRKSWRFSGDFGQDPFLDNVAKRLSFSAVDFED